MEETGMATAVDDCVIRIGKPTECCGRRYFVVNDALHVDLDTSNGNVLSLFAHLGVFEVYRDGRVLLCDMHTGDVVASELETVEMKAKTALPNAAFGSKRSKRAFQFVVWKGTNIIRSGKDANRKILGCTARGDIVCFGRAGLFRYHGPTRALMPITGAWPNPVCWPALHMVGADGIPVELMETSCCK